MKPTNVQQYVLYPVHTLLQWLPLAWCVLFYTYYFQMTHMLGAWPIRFKNDPGLYIQDHPLVSFETGLLQFVLYGLVLLIPAYFFLNIVLRITGTDIAERLLSKRRGVVFFAGCVLLICTLFSGPFAWFMD